MAFDTQNPVGNELLLAKYLQKALAKFNPEELELVQVTRPNFLDNPAAYVYARWGAGSRLLNAHFDTVPKGIGWDNDPFTLTLQDDKLYGLGAVDIKGAIATIIAVLDETLANPPKDLAILFSGDEEAGSLCMSAFLQTKAAERIKKAVVCEPTCSNIITSHRGIITFSISIEGPGGHSSRADRTIAPILQLAKIILWLKQYLSENYPAAINDFCYNPAAIDGGVASNVIPTKATLIASLRPPAGYDVAEIEAALANAIKSNFLEANYTLTLILPSFQVQNAKQFFSKPRPEAIAEFWTEAALLCRAGINAIVMGPGNIKQAHQPNEYVSVNELLAAVEYYKDYIYHV